MKKVLSSTVVAAVVISSIPLQTFAENDSMKIEKENIKLNQIVPSKTGNIEADINFSLPVKNVVNNSFNMKLTLTKGENTVAEIPLGSENLTSGFVYEGKTYNYTIQRLKFDGKTTVGQDEKAYYYRVNFENLECNDEYSPYNLTLSGNGFNDSNSGDIVLDNYSKRVIFSNTVENDEKTGSILFGDVNKDGVVNDKDYDRLLENIDSSNLEYDLNRDLKVNVSDLAYIKHNIGKTQKNPVIKDTKVIVDTSTVSVEAPQDAVKGQVINGNAASLFEENNEVVTVTMPSGTTISEQTPAKIALDLGVSAKSEHIMMEQIVIKGGANGPVKGSVNVDGVDYPYDLTKNEIKRNVQSDIVIDLNGQKAVSKITISITETTKNDRNLAEIAKVEFLNNVYKEIPKPEMNIPNITNIVTSTKVGNEKMYISWKHEPNVTGYEVKVEEIDGNGKTKSTKIFKTSENSLSVRDIKAYGRYRVSIQSLNGEWQGGYKEATPEDIDGVPENIDPSTIESGQYLPTPITPDSIVEIMVIPEDKPEPPEGVSVKGKYKSLDVSWKAHNSAQSFDVYYKQLGTKNDYIKANSEPIKNRTNFTIGDLEDGKTYEIKMTATNHHGTSGMSKGYTGTTSSIKIPNSPNYNLINLPNSNGGLTQNIENVELTLGNGITNDSEYSVVDNDYTTAWTLNDWDASQYSKRGPIVTFDKEYTIDTIGYIARLDSVGASPYLSNIGVFNEKTKSWEYVNARVLNKDDNGKYTILKLDKPVTTKKIQVNTSVYGGQKLSISELKFYEYDSVEDDVKNLFKDELQIELRTSTPVNQEEIDELRNRLNTKDENTNEYHPDRENLLKELQIAQDLLNDKEISEKVVTIDPNINQAGTNIGYSNDWQALGFSAKAGDTINIYLATDQPNREIHLGYEQHYGESGKFMSTKKIVLRPGKNTIQLEKLQDINVEKGGNLYVKFPYSGNHNANIKIRVSGATEIPHLNLNNLLQDVNYLTSNENNNSDEKVKIVKDKIRKYILFLKDYTAKLPSLYKENATQDDNINNIYSYDERTSVLNSTNIEGDRFTLTLPATQVYKGIVEGTSSIEEQVDKLYNNVLAWEQIIQITNAKKGVYENADFDKNGTVTNEEEAKFKKHQAPKSRVNVKYQRMFIGAFMYASGHHVGIEFDSSKGMVNGIPYKFDENGKITNKDEARLFGWGISHEIGHKADIPLRVYSETTNNILALITQTFDDEDPSRLENGGYEKIYEKVTSQSVGVSQDIFTLLGMFWQLHLAYEDNYTYEMLENNNDADESNDSFYAKLNRAYRETKAETNDKDQLLIRRASDAAGKDLRGFFASWGLIADESTSIYLQQKFENPEDRETRKIQYLNDEARRKRLNAIDKNDMSLITMANDTNVISNFVDVANNSIVNSNSISMNFNVDKDNNKILGYEIIRSDGNYLNPETNKTEVKYRPVGFVSANSDGSASFTDNIAPLNNRALTYKVVAYDYNLNPTREFEVGSVKLSHEGVTDSSNYTFKTNTVSTDDVNNENNSHGPVENPSINNIKDNDDTTVYKGRKLTKEEYDKNTQKDPDININEDPYVIIDMNESENIVGLKYTKPVEEVSKFSLKNLFKRNKNAYESIDKYEIHVSNDKKSWTKVSEGTFKFGQENILGTKDPDNVARVTFTDKLDSSGTKMWAYEAKYVKLVSKGKSSLQIADIEIIGEIGDNIEIGAVDKNTGERTNGIGKLGNDYVVQADNLETDENEEIVIPKGSILINGEYKGDPAFNVPLLIDENNNTIAGEGFLLANVPDNSPLGTVASGKWMYYVAPENFNKLTSKVKAELYRFNELNQTEAGLSPVGQRLVSDTLYTDVAPTYDELPTITLEQKALKSNKNTKVIHIDESIKAVKANRNN